MSGTCMAGWELVGSIRRHGDVVKRVLGGIMIT